MQYSAATLVRIKGLPRGRTLRYPGVPQRVAKCVFVSPPHRAIQGGGQFLPLSLALGFFRRRPRLRSLIKTSRVSGSISSLLMPANSSRPAVLFTKLYSTTATTPGGQIEQTIRFSHLVSGLTRLLFYATG